MEVPCPKQRKRVPSASITSRWKLATSKLHWLSTAACSTLSCGGKAPLRPLSTWATSSLRSRRAVPKLPTTAVISDSWSTTRRRSAAPWPTQASQRSPVRFSTSSTHGATGSRLSDTTTFSSPKRRTCCAEWDSRIFRRTKRRSRSLPTRAWRLGNYEHRGRLFGERPKDLHDDAAVHQPFFLATLAIAGEVRRLAVKVERDVIHVHLVEQEELGFLRGAVHTIDETTGLCAPHCGGLLGKKRRQRIALSLRCP